MFFKFLIFKVEVENQFLTRIQYFQCDGGGEYINIIFTNFLQQYGVISQIFCPYTSQQNEMVEHTHHTIINVVCTLLIDSNLAYQF